LATYRLGDDIPAPAPADQSRTLAVAGEGALVEKLRRALLAELTASSLLTNGEWVVETNAGNNNLDLLVTIESSYVSKWFLPAQLVRGLLLSIVLYPILGMLVMLCSRECQVSG
jgi:hypothetical protein